MNDLNSIVSQISCATTRIVSFDVFDTLLCRYVAYPRDLLELYDEKFRSLLNGFPLLSFSKERFLLEDQFRKNSTEVDKSREEVSFEEIYAFIQDSLGLSTDLIAQLKSLELEIERKHLRPRQSGILLLNAALKAGKTVVLLSDMYLPQPFLEEVLSTHGIIGFDRLYLSSTHNKKKSTGNLFRQVLEDYRAQPHTLLHIGDNYSSDIKPAQELNISTFHFPKALDRFLQMEGNQNLYGNKLKKADLGYRTVIGFLANKLFDDPFRKVENFSLFNGESQWLGYAIYGPLMLFMTKWIIEESSLEGYDEIMFLARDGFILNKIYPDLARHYKNPPKAKYIYSSRNVFLPWTLCSEIHFAFTHHYVGVNSNHITFRKLLVDRLGANVTDETIRALCQEGFTDLDKPVGGDLRQFLQVIRDEKYGIASSNQLKVCVARQYFRQFFTSDKKQACFDIGWRGTSQIYLTELLDQPIDFFYLACKNLAFEAQHKYGYKAKPYMNFSNDFFDNFNSFPVLLENIFGDPGSSTCISFRDNGDKIEPVFSGSILAEKPQKVIRDIQHGVMSFVEDFLTWLKEDITLLHAIPQHFLAPVLDTINHPFPIDASSLLDITSENILMMGKHIDISESWNPTIRQKPPVRYKAVAHIEGRLKKSKTFMKRHFPELTKHVFAPAYKKIRIFLSPFSRRV